MHKRASSQYNILLAKDDVGTARNYTKRLPSPGFAYGKMNKPDKFNAKAGKYAF